MEESFRINLQGIEEEIVQMNEEIKQINVDKQ